MDDRICGTCRHFEWATQTGRGWCRNPRLYTANQSQPVSEFELACATRQGDFWEASDDVLPQSSLGATEPEPPVDRSLEYDEHEVLSGGSQMRGSSADQPKSSDDPMYPQPPDVPPARSSRSTGSAAGVSSSPGGSGDRPSGYQTEERYWTDYLRIALPIAGLLLLLSVFWYWASSFIGDDNNGTQTPVVAVNVTPQDAPTLTPTLQDAVQLTPQVPTPTTAAAQPTQAPAEPTQAPAEPTQAPAEPTEAAGSGAFAAEDLVIVNDDNVNMRAEPSTTGEIVDTLTQGTELRILSATSTDFTDDQGNTYTYWNVSNDATGSTGWVAGDFLEK
jgi:hypothetical protein